MNAKRQTKSNNSGAIPHDGFTEERFAMVGRQVAARGITDPNVIRAMEKVPRQAFLPEELAEFAYEDSPLVIGLGQTISQPYIVALMTEALELSELDRVLEVGSGSGYAAAVLGEIAADVVTVERLEPLAKGAARCLRELGYDNVTVICGDGTKGYKRAAPYDAIAVAGGGVEVPKALRRQLAIGGRMVIPVGPAHAIQELRRIRRVDEDEFTEESLGHVSFVPLIAGEIEDKRARPEKAAEAGAPPPATPAEVIFEYAEPFADIETADLDRLLDRIGNSRVVLIGEASHGTSEFYRMRARITRELIEKAGFTIVAAEADWPDAAHIDHYVRHKEYPPGEWTAFSRFPTWMWRNREVREFVDWLRERNGHLVEPDRRTAFYGLDIYSLFISADAVIAYLDRVDPDAAAIARERYGCLTPWQADPAGYGRAAVSGRYEGCTEQVVAILSGLLEKRQAYLDRDGERFMDAKQNARLVANAEQYYRKMYFGSRDSWNLRDRHMFETLVSAMAHRGPYAKAVVWAHNSHIGDARATEMAAKGELNVGELCRKEFGEDAYLIGFGTHKGTVAAASSWGGDMRVKTVNPSLKKSFEHLCHESGLPTFLLPLRGEYLGGARDLLLEEHLERAIGVIYRPESERHSHYFYAEVARQFDEYIWFDETEAVTPIETHEVAGLPDTYPFGL